MRNVGESPKKRADMSLLLSFLPKQEGMDGYFSNPKEKTPVSCHISNVAKWHRPKAEGTRRKGKKPKLMVLMNLFVRLSPCAMRRLTYVAVTKDERNAVDMGFPTAS